MGENSNIQWTTHTFNPWVGCQRVSPGCVNCYAEAYDKRVGGVPKSKRKNPDVQEMRWGPTAPRVRTSASYWRQPLRWNEAALKAGQRHRVFCASLADVFEDRPELAGWRMSLFDLVRKTPHLDWLLLTKRPENIRDQLMQIAEGLRFDPSDDGLRDWIWAWMVGRSPPSNVWLGTTVEDQQRANERIPALLSVPARVRFLSCEPLLEQLDLTYPAQLWPNGPGFCCDGGTPSEPCGCEGRPMDPPLLYGIDWVIIGGESGPGARPFNVAWGRSLVRQAQAGGAKVFLKQLGSNIRTRNDDHLIGDYNEGGWFLNADWQIEEHVNGYRENYQGAEVRIRLVESHGGDPEEWPLDLRVREFPGAQR